MRKFNNSHKQVKRLVAYFLTKYMDTRNSDDKLLARIWSFEADKLNITSKEEFVMAMHSGKFSKASTIIRVRREIQKNNNNLQASENVQRERAREESSYREFYSR